MQVWPEGQAGIEVRVEGFSHKLPVLLTYIMTGLLMGQWQLPVRRRPKRHPLSGMPLLVKQPTGLAPSKVHLSKLTLS